MSRRRAAGEIVRRMPGSGFVGSADPELVRVPDGELYVSDADWCMMGCGDPECREWGNLEIMSGPYAGSEIFHISECQMLDHPALAASAKEPHP